MSAKHSEAQYTLGKRTVDLSDTDRRNYDVFTALPIREGANDIAYADEEHAAYIVRCVNSHTDIQTALRWALRYVRMPQDIDAEEFCTEYNAAVRASNL